MEGEEEMTSEYTKKILKRLDKMPDKISTFKPYAYQKSYKRRNIEKLRLYQREYEKKEKRKLWKKAYYLRKKEAKKNAP